MIKTGKFDTKVIHSGELDPRVFGAVVTPVFQSSTYEYGEPGAYADIKYIRLNNTPNHRVLHDKFAALEGGEAALVSGSGMATISSALLAFLKSGDHLLAQRSLYGGTHGLVTQDLPDLGIATDFFDANAPATWAAKLRPTTRVIYVEAMSNPTLSIPDLRAVVEFAKAHGLISMIDNTFASPVNLRPIELGFDLSVHSATKYLNGHSDIVAGAVIGSKKHLETITHKLNHLGGTLDPHACFLLSRGMKTLALRVRHQNESALRIARFLEKHAAILSVSYPGLESHSQHARARELFDGFGGMVAFRVKGGAAAATRVIERVKIPAHAPSLGGVESLITRPASTTHMAMSPADREAMGIADDLIRYSVGLEAAEDLIEDLAAALR